jgi:hypothetical protein
MPGAIAQGIDGEDRSAGCGVVKKAVRERWGDRLPADRAALLAELDETAVGVEILEVDTHGAASAAGQTRCAIGGGVRREGRRCH